MSVPPRVSQVTLGVADVARSTEFYETLGWRVSPASVPGLVTHLETAGGLLSLVKTDDLSAGAGIAPRDATDFRGVLLTIFVESRDEVDEALRAAVQAGAALIKTASNTERGGNQGYFADPDGHVWEISFPG